MAIAFQCQCGARYEMRDQDAGMQVRCPACMNVMLVPGVASAVDPLFSLPRLGVKQKKLAISECYYIRDEQERVLAFAVRPRYVFRNLLSAGACVAVIVLGLALSIALMSLLLGDKPGAIGVILLFIGAFGSVIAGIALAIFLSPKRHLTFYRDEQKNHPFLEVLQDSKFQPIVATYTVRIPDGSVIGHFRKNYLYNFFRKQWQVLGPGGELVAMAKEDSILLSVLRRFLGSLYGILRTNFILVRGDSEQVIGEFNRKFTLFDSYVLDLSADVGHVLDRRVALGLGVMLDTGERR
jgi:uncharacterized protein YxjI